MTSGSLGPRGLVCAFISASSHVQVLLAVPMPASPQTASEDAMRHFVPLSLKGRLVKLHHTVLCLPSHCRCVNPEACPGGSNASLGDGRSEDFKSSQCSIGYMGNLCAMCDWQRGYGTATEFTCRPCLQPSATIALYSIAALVMLVAVRVLTALVLADTGPSATAPNQARPVDFVKPIVLYAQYLFIITSINGVPWPAPISVVMKALTFFWASASANSLGLDCVLPRYAALPLAIQKTLFSLLMPFGILCVLLLVDVLWSFMRACRAPRTRRALPAHISTRDRFVSLVLCISFLFLPTWLHAVFALFTCISLDVPASFPYEAEAVGSFLASDMNEQCYQRDGYHRAWALGLGVPLLLLFCFVVPVGLFVFLWLSKRHKKLDQDRFRKHYGFLYRTWRQEVCWWEAVSVCQTICLVIIGSFGHVLGVYYQALVVLAALSVFCVLLLLVKPHDSRAAGAVTLFSVWVLMATSFSALTFLPYRNAIPAYGYTMAMGVFVLVTNVAFVLSTLWRLLRLLQWGIVRRLLGSCCGSHAPCPIGPCSKMQTSTHALFGAFCLLRQSVDAAWPAASSSGCCSCQSTVRHAESVNGIHGGQPKPHSRQQQQPPLPEGAPAACTDC